MPLKAEDFLVFSLSENDKVLRYKYPLNYPGKGSELFIS
jgi:hypothetical protein